MSHDRTDGYLHEALLYRTDEQFLATAVPFLEAGACAGEVSLVALGPVTTRLLRGHDLDASVRFLEDGSHYNRPAVVIRAYRDLLTEVVAQGATRVRLLGEVPHPGLGMSWDEWARYEATTNHAYAPFPVWGLCPYDLRITSAAVLDDVLRTHPFLRGDDGEHQANDRYTAPEEFLATRPAPRREVRAEAGPPTMELTDPTPATARRAARELSVRTTLRPDEVDDLVTAVSEAVTNALTHGAGPARLRLWSEPHRVVATVHDRGPGPADPFAGLLPTADTATGGLGLWIIHQICDQVTLDRAVDGFTLRLVVGAPDPTQRGRG